MLTQDQKNQLEPLTLHPRFGKLLIEAMKAWEIGEPKKGSYGVFYNFGVRKYIPEDNKPQCCLIGASLYNKQFPAESCGYSYNTTSTYSIYELEITGLINGFDMDEIQHKDDELYIKAYNFGLSVSKLCFPNS